MIFVGIIKVVRKVKIKKFSGKLKVSPYGDARGQPFPKSVGDRKVVPLTSHHT